MPKKLTQEEFITRSNKLHEDKYDYSETVYKNCREKISIKCPIHGFFEQKAENHLCGWGCASCAKDSQNL